MRFNQVYHCQAFIIVCLLHHSNLRRGLKRSLKCALLGALGILTWSLRRCNQYRGSGAHEGWLEVGVKEEGSERGFKLVCLVNLIGM